MPPISYARRWFPPVIVQHAIWLCLRFTLGCRDVEGPLAERGLDISYEAVRRWVFKFGPASARRPRQGRARPTEHRELDEMTAASAASGRVPGARCTARARRSTSWSSAGRTRPLPRS